MALPGIARPARGGKHESLFGLINMNGRFYDPRIGRFLSPDNGACPAKGGVQIPDFTQNFNRYSYCLNNPLVFKDPDGESIILAAIIIGASIGIYTGYKIADAKGYDLGDWQTYGYT